MSESDRESMPSALAGLRILDLSGDIGGPLGVLVLAEHGADVIKVEPPGGHADRATPSSRVFNRSKRSITLDLTTPDGHDAFLDLCDTADALVESSGAGAMEGLGLGYDQLAERCPRLVYCSVPAWPTGTRYQDRPGHEPLVHARTGQQWEITSFRAGPTFLHNPVAGMAAAMLVPLGIMAALHARERTGRGQHVEVSLLQGALMLTSQIWNWTDRGSFSLPKTVPPSVHQATIYECANGEWIHAATMSGITPTRSEASILGIRELSQLEVMALSPEERQAFEEEKQLAFKRHRRDDLVAQYHAAGLGAEAIVAPHERLTHPQLVATESIVQVDDPEVGTTTQFGVPVFLTGTPGAVRGPQPRPGEHTDEVLTGLGRTADDIASLQERGIV